MGELTKSESSHREQVPTCAAGRRPTSAEDEIRLMCAPVTEHDTRQALARRIASRMWGREQRALRHFPQTTFLASVEISARPSSEGNAARQRLISIVEQRTPDDR